MEDMFVLPVLRLIRLILKVLYSGYKAYLFGKQVKE